MINQFNFRKNKTEAPVIAVATQEAKQPATNYPAIVTQIHKEFNTAGEALLQNALQILEDCKTKDLQKGKALISLGFINSKEATDAQETELAEQTAKKNSELVRHYSANYPFNKFITEDVVKQICSKYGLVLGETSQYTGFVPANKIKDIAEFDIKQADWSYYSRFIGSWSWAGDEEDGGECAEKYPNTYKKAQKKLPLKICAPLKDMKTEGYHVEGHKLVKDFKDPIVLQPVNGGYLIVCAWGDEASDELVVNVINN